MKKHIPKEAFNDMMQAVKHFEQVDEGCGFELLDERIDDIKNTHKLTEAQIDIVFRWACRTYYNEHQTPNTKLCPDQHK